MENRDNISGAEILRHFTQTLKVSDAAGQTPGSCPLQSCLILILSLLHIQIHKMFY